VGLRILTVKTGEFFPTVLLSECWSRLASKHFVTHASFDERVSEETKAVMVENFTRPPNPLAPKRLDKKTFDHKASLESYVSFRSLNIFNLLSINGQEEVKVFSSKSPVLWPSDQSYQLMKKNVKLLKVINYSAERGVTPIQSYNGALR
jgi:hypothetical protein